MLQTWGRAAPPPDRVTSVAVEADGEALVSVALSEGGQRIVLYSSAGTADGDVRRECLRKGVAADWAEWRPGGRPGRLRGGVGCSGLVMRPPKRMKLEVDTDSGQINVRVKDRDTGDWVCNLLSERGGTAFAESALAVEGYPADWAEWSSDGAFVRLLDAGVFRDTPPERPVEILVTGDMSLAALVDGKHTAYVASPGGTACACTRELLAREGGWTGWAEWDAGGRMVRLKGL